MSSATLIQALTAPWPVFDEEQQGAAMATLASGKVNYWTGQEGRAFEREFAEHFGAKRAVALMNGTVALELAFVSLGLEPGDEVIVTPRTFLASASSLVLYGLVPVFADVSRESGNITAESVEAVLTSKTKAILCVHLGGWPCDMPGIMELASAHGLKVIEDCAQSHGAKIEGRFVGSFGHVNAWSFCQDKIMTTGGEGGMLTTDDEELWRRAWAYKDHGKSYEAVYERQHAPGFRWLHESFGTNWRMAEFQSAIGRVQLRRLADWKTARTRNASVLIEALKPFDSVRVPVTPSGVENAFYRLYVYVVADRLADGWSRDRIMQEISASGVPCFVGSCSEVYLEKAFDGHPSRPKERLPVARELGETSLCFLVHPTLSEEQMRLQAGLILGVLERATKGS